MITKALTSLLDKRDELIFRRLAGEKLNFLQERFVSMVDAMVANQLPSSERLPEGMKRTIEELNTLMEHRK
jgi:hypothetical protein